MSDDAKRQLIQQYIETLTKIDDDAIQQQQEAAQKQQESILRNYHERFERTGGESSGQSKQAD